MTRRLDHARILMYSHDTFGLGHLRRCRTIAHSLVEEFRGLNVLIISGAPIAGAFDYRARVDFLKIPSVIKRRNGEYTSLAQHVDLADTMEMRRRMIFNAAQTFQPDMMIVDKEPLGLDGEVEDTLAYLKTIGTTLVLGLREVMDAPDLLRREWTPKGMLSKVAALYDDIWVYGPPDFYNPLVGLDVPASVSAKLDFVGFLQRAVPEADLARPKPDSEYILVTTGGGGDGADLVQAVIGAYEAVPGMPRAVVVLGPYMPMEQRKALMARAAPIETLSVVEFEPHMEALIAGSAAVVAMGGYNTYCEILSFDKPALIVPRLQPRQEQLVRALRARELGLIGMMLPDEAADPVRMAAALKALPGRTPPSKVRQDLRLEGLSRINEIVGARLARPVLSIVQSAT
ncbi:glycosyltransferase family protein [Prosthecomicrobium sp. N25]|uniref:glycosyltransferase family protein n=1 Tax=Prosthecomicrobium sp. N25 TaxID=3129254 RepID=UPI0030788EB2